MAPGHNVIDCFLEAAVQKYVYATQNLDVLSQSVEQLIVENGVCKGVILADDQIISANAVVITTGTFLNG